MPSSAQPQPLLDRIEARLRRPGVIRGSVLLALLLCAPSIGTGLVVDDHVHLKFVTQQLSGSPDAAGIAWWDMFDVAGRAGAWDVMARVFVGVLPWWTSPELSMAFLRPLGVASHFIDYGLWPGQPWLMHVHNLLWYAGLIALVGLFYRRVMGAGVAASLGVLMYAVDEAHAEGAAWIASRNTLMTAFFVLLTLVLHDRARRDGWAPGRWLTPLALAAALLCSEGGTAAFAYLLPYALFIDRAPPARRLLSLLAPALVAGAWQLAYRKLGYGIYGSGLYLDPGDDLLHFLSALPARLPIVLRDQFVLPAMVFEAFPASTQAVLNGLAVAAAACLLLVAAPLVMRRPTLAFWLSGALLSAVPICAIGSTPRLLFVTALGAFGLFAELAACALEAWRQRAGPGKRALLLATASFFLCVHVPVAMALSPVAARRLLAYDELIKEASRSFPWGDDLAGKSLFVLNTPNYFVTTFAWAYVEGPAPRSAHILGASMNAVVVTRESEDTLVLAPEGGYLLEPWSTLVRRADERFEVGQRIAIGEMWIEVFELTPDGRPRRIRCHLSAMGSGRFVWVYWNGPKARYQRVPIPPPGHSLRIPAEADPDMQLNADDLLHSR